MPAPFWLTHPSIPGSLIPASTTAQRDRYLANGWTLTDPPDGTDNEEGLTRWLIAYDIGRTVAPLGEDGKVPADRLPAASGSGLDESDVAAMFAPESLHTGVAFTFDPVAKKLSVDVSGALDLDAAAELVADLLDAGTHDGIEVERSPSTGTPTAIAIKLKDDAVQAIVAAVFAGTHEGVEVEAGATPGTLKLTVTATDAAIGDGTLTGAKLVEGTIGRREVNDEEVPAYNVAGGLPVADDGDPETAPSRSFLDDTLATALALIYADMTDRSVWVADTAANPRALQMPASGGPYAVVWNGTAWVAVATSTFGGSSTPADGTITPAKLAPGGTTPTAVKVYAGDGTWQMVDDLIQANTLDGGMLLIGTLRNAQIASDAAIGLTKLASISSGRFLGNVSGGSGPASALTAAQMRGGLGVGLIARGDSAVTKNTSIAEETLLTYALPAAGVVPGDRIHLRASGLLKFNNGTPDLTIRVKVGGMTLESAALPSPGLSANQRAWVLDVVIHARATTNALVDVLFLASNTGTVDLRAQSSGLSVVGSAQGSVTWANANTISFTSQFGGTGGSHVNNEISCTGWEMERIPA